MPLTALDLSPEALKKYRPLEAIRRRKARTSTELAKRRRLAIATARKAARLLREKFGAKEVILFGSLARHGGLTLFPILILLFVVLLRTAFLKRSAESQD